MEKDSIFSNFIKFGKSITEKFSLNSYIWFWRRYVW
jgi:hypothetical protein